MRDVLRLQRRRDVHSRKRRGRQRARAALRSGRDPSCFEDVSCGFDPAIEGLSYEKFLDDGDTVEVCISDSDGFDGPGSLGQCTVNTGFITGGPAEVVRALDADLKPIVPAPAVGVE